MLCDVYLRLPSPAERSQFFITSDGALSCKLAGISTVSWPVFFFFFAKLLTLTYSGCCVFRGTGHTNTRADNKISLWNCQVWALALLIDRWIFKCDLKCRETHSFFIFFKVVARKQQMLTSESLSEQPSHGSIMCLFRLLTIIWKHSFSETITKPHSASIHLPLKEQR